jgi:hypothetical protein
MCKLNVRACHLINLGVNSASLVEWLLDNCSKEKVKPDEILSKDAIKLLAERLITPLQIIYYLASAIEKGYQIGEKPISGETLNSILSPDLDAIEPSLVRHGYNFAVLCERLNVKRHEIKAYLRGQLNPNRAEEINKEIHKLGVLV